MPVLHLKVAPQVFENYERLAEALTRLAHELLGKRPELTAVLIEDWPAARWYVGGRAVRRPTALLEIDITRGTNTADEKAAFIARAHAYLQRELGHGAPLEQATYVIVRELPGTDWGYAGRTQQARRACSVTAAVPLAELTR
jgi:4-oxalocrotonate tautomerase